MSDEKTAVILLIGTELTEGKVQDRHGRFLAGELTALGVLVNEMRIIPDSGTVKEIIHGYHGQVDLILITGGLGPTADDITREMVAGALMLDLEYQEEVWEDLLRRYPGGLSESNRVQAYIPKGFTLLPNRFGTAPGFAGGDHPLIVALPGPPSELHGVFQEEAFPLLKRKFFGPVENTLVCTSLVYPEARIEEVLQSIASGKVTWGTRAEPFRIVITLRGGSQKERMDTFRRLEEILGPIFLREGEFDPVKHLVEVLKAKDLTIVTVESCTGGYFGKVLTDIPGASEIFWGGIICYSRQSKMKVLGVSRETLEIAGPVSCETALEMSRGGLALSEADLSLGITGIAGPSGGAKELPVGTVWIAAVSAGGGSVTRKLNLGSTRQGVRKRAVVAGILLIEELIRDERLDNCGY
ncbi:MAG: nicotinamide-nucleotide amidohydrolase family protein [Spirochaetales bacterium]|nr:nicotinamide-nucleotide amidohydrolase family protein [Spirochaetales bacterium]